MCNQGQQILLLRAFRVDCVRFWQCAWSEHKVLWDCMQADTVLAAPIAGTKCCVQAGYCWRPSFPQLLQAILQSPPFMLCPAGAGLPSCLRVRAGNMKQLLPAALPMASQSLASKYASSSCLHFFMRDLCSRNVLRQIEL